jgi:hypothetical protein
MKEVLNVIKNFLEKNGGIKILVAFAVLIISVLILNGNLDKEIDTVFGITGCVSLVYILIAGGVYFIAGIINSIKELFKK